MANIKSAKKRIKVIEKKTMQNKMFKSSHKTLVKKYTAAVAAGDKAGATTLYTQVVKKTDKAAARGIMHKNTAARRISRYSLMLNNMSA